MLKLDQWPTVISYTDEVCVCVCEVCVDVPAIINLWFGPDIYFDIKKVVKCMNVICGGLVSNYSVHVIIIIVMPELIWRSS